eukprot:TRINITY_DN4488_c0_g1_i7.p2 TRINITY_DN4488_c0_g1~~TRINITY_DN4488_c0_g1_i7.p2  ORF type:complete len:195 (-),score=47.29 TRINITY_DN4488_c0_g1_i7:36-620(-)
MFKQFVVILLLCVIFSFVIGERGLKQSGKSNAVAQAAADADESVFTRKAKDEDKKKQSQAQATSIFTALSRKELQAATRAFAKIARYNSNKPNNKPTLTLEVEGVTQVKGKSDQKKGVGAYGGSVIEALATPDFGALQIQSEVVVEEKGKGKVAATNEQEGEIKTKDGDKASFSTSASVEDNGKNSKADRPKLN